MEDEESVPQQFRGWKPFQRWRVPFSYWPSEIEAGVIVRMWQAIGRRFVWWWTRCWSDCYCSNRSRRPRGSCSERVYRPTLVGGTRRLRCSRAPHRPQDEAAWRLGKLMPAALGPARRSPVWSSYWGVRWAAPIWTGHSFGNPRSKESSCYDPPASAQRLLGEHHEVNLRSSWLQVHRPSQ